MSGRIYKGISKTKSALERAVSTPQTMKMRDRKGLPSMQPMTSKFELVTVRKFVQEYLIPEVSAELGDKRDPIVKKAAEKALKKYEEDLEEQTTQSDEIAEQVSATTTTHSTLSATVSSTESVLGVEKDTLQKLPEGLYLSDTKDCKKFSTFKEAFGRDVIFTEEQTKLLMQGAKSHFMTQYPHKKWDHNNKSCQDYVKNYMEGAKYYYEIMNFKDMKDRQNKDLPMKTKIEAINAHMLGAKVKTIKFVFIPEGSTLLSQQNTDPEQKHLGNYFAPIGQHPIKSGITGFEPKITVTSSGTHLFGREDRLCQSNPEKSMVILESETNPINVVWTKELSFSQGHAGGGGIQWVIPKGEFTEVPGIVHSNDGFKLKHKEGSHFIESETISFLPPGGTTLLFGDEHNYLHIFSFMHDKYGLSAASSDELNTAPGVKPIKKS